MHKQIYILIISLVFLSSCMHNTKKVTPKSTSQDEINNQKIQVLNFGTFHMGSTTDASQVDFDEEDKKNSDEVHQLAKALAEFKPTIIVVETPPEKNEQLNNKYQQYLSNPTIASTYYGEVGLLAFEIARLNKISTIYGIDHKMNYNYNIGNEIDNTLDKTTYSNYFKNTKEIKIDYQNLSLLEHLNLMNSKRYLGFLIEVNADILTHVGTNNNFEGADAAAKYYQRNLRMYSNLNRIPMTSKDRVFILLGASHTAFFMDFMKRSPKYQAVNTFDYLPVER